MIKQVPGLTISLELIFVSLLLDLLVKTTLFCHLVTQILCLFMEAPTYNTGS